MPEVVTLRVAAAASGRDLPHAACDLQPRGTDRQRQGTGTASRGQQRLGTTRSAVSIACPTARQVRCESHRATVKPQGLPHAGRPNNYCNTARCDRAIRKSLLSNPRLAVQTFLLSLYYLVLLFHRELHYCISCVLASLSMKRINELGVVRY